MQFFNWVNITFDFSGCLSDECFDEGDAKISSPWKELKNNE